jgi:hypothetical protein
MRKLVTVAGVVDGVDRVEARWPRGPGERARKEGRGASRRPAGRGEMAGGGVEAGEVDALETPLLVSVPK